MDLEGISSADCAIYMDPSAVEKEGKKGLRYMELIAPIVKAIQELSQKIDDLDTRITTLEG